MNRLMSVDGTLPNWRKSITFDRGSSFRNWRKLASLWNRGAGFVIRRCRGRKDQSRPKRGGEPASDALVRTLKSRYEVDLRPLERH
jgi:hypothetical protein